MKRTKVALIYDFDETLSTTYMQDYLLIPKLGMKPETFWKKANAWSIENKADQVTGSMYYFTKIAREKNICLSREMLKECGKNIEYYEGVEDWFNRINMFGKYLDLDIEHYIISSGYEEIIEGCSIRRYFKEVAGCAFAFDENGMPIWPARVVNYQAKIQYLSKINKGLKKLDDMAVNEYIPDENRPIPYTRIIYFGDGLTDVPSMKMVKSRNGTAIAVYKPKSPKKRRATQMLKDDRVNFALPADYREGKGIDRAVKAVLYRIAVLRDLETLQKEEEKKIKAL
ncbi:MAG: haloacid dehalogenase-like hydrolase [Alphaproteobacteria bacterium]|nr:haloacid dehalogenase-like hydrolase [Alphaproteobacteria bacterium]